jgi:GNAT superfamily N-acetyltransferase
MQLKSIDKEGGVPAMDVLIRPAKKVDMPSMCLLLSELFSIEADFSPDRQKQATGISLLLNDKSDLSIVLVAEKGEEIVGMCSVQTLISTAQGGPVGLLEDLIVRKDSRGNGIGKRLLSEIFRWCATKNISRLQLLRDLDNESALKFYECNGWAETRLVCMRKTL